VSAPAVLMAAVTVAALLAAGLAGAVVGVAAGERASEAAAEELVLTDPARLAETPASALRSAGGFTGFGGLPALPGEVLRAGTVVETRDGDLVLDSGGSEVEIRFRAPRRLFRIEPLAGVLAAGDLVVVRLVDGEPQAVLRVPPDLEEGAGAGAE
jgi:hypothetical protein